MFGRAIPVFVSAGLTVGLFDVVLAWLRPSDLKLTPLAAVLLLPSVLAMLGLTGAVVGLAAAPAGIVLRTPACAVLRTMASRPARWTLIGLVAAAFAVVSLAWLGPTLGVGGQLTMLCVALLVAAVPGAVLSQSANGGDGQIAPWRLPEGRRERLLIVGLVALVLTALSAVGVSQDLRLQAWRRTGAARAVMGAWAAATDLDGDGYSGLLFGPDCRPFDGAIHPGAADLPGNGVDEDCAGGDHLPSVEPAGVSRRGGGLSGRSLVLVTVSGLRSDRTGAGGSERMVTPGLDLLATRAAVFPRAYAAAPTGPAALFGLMTGRRPGRTRFAPAWLGPDDRITVEPPDGSEKAGTFRRLPDLPSASTVPTLAELLKAAGYHTVAVTCCDWQRRGGGLLRGFDVVDDLAFQTRNRGGDGVVADVLVRQAARQAIRAHGRRYFLWVHLPDAAAPFLFHAGTPYFGDAPSDRLDGELAFVDAQLASLLDDIERAGVTDNALVAVVGVHGVSVSGASSSGRGFAEGRAPGASSRPLGEELIRAPIYLWLPDASRRHTPAPVRHVDLFPTFLELLGIGQPTPARELDGSSLVPLLTAEANSPGAVMAREALSEDFTHGRDVRALVSGSWKLVEDKRIGTVELYDLSSDPKERENVAAQMPERTESLRRRLADLTTGRGEVAR